MSFKEFFAKTTLSIRKHSPEILVISGVVGLVTAGVLACKQTTKLDATLKKGEERLDALAEKMDKLEEVSSKLPEEEREEYKLSEKEEHAEITRVWIQNAFSVVKLYTVPVLLGAASVASILGGFGILKKREVAISMAFAEMSAAYSELKKRIKDSVGEEKAKEIIDGVKKEMKEAIDENGHPSVVEVDTVNPINDPYTFVWDEVTTRETGAYHRGCPEDNEAFLRGVEASVNQKLRCLKGYMFLNEVLRDLGLPETKAGQEVGWVVNPCENHKGDNYIDFGLEAVDDVDKETLKFTRRYVLHFNCDGYILDTFEHAFEGDR